MSEVKAIMSTSSTGKPAQCTKVLSLQQWNGQMPRSKGHAART